MLQSITITRKELHRGIKEMLKVEGFKYISSSMGGIVLKKFTNDDFWWISYQIIDNAHYHSLYELGFRIRIGIVEQFLFDFIPKFTTNFIKPEYWPTYTEQWGFYGWSEQEQERFSSIRSMEDIGLVLHEFKELYQEKKSTVFGKYHDLNTINEWYWERVENFPSEWPDKFNALAISQSIFRHLGISKLAKDPKYDNLVGIYRNKVQSLDNEAFQQTLNNFIIYLSKQELPQWERPW